MQQTHRDSTEALLGLQGAIRCPEPAQAETAALLSQKPVGSGVASFRKGQLLGRERVLHITAPPRVQNGGGEIKPKRKETL